MSDDDDLPPDPPPPGPPPPPAPPAQPPPPTGGAAGPPQVDAPAADGTEGTDLERGIDNAVGDVEEVVDDVGSAAKNTGEAKQDLEEGKKELEDGDQDTADKAAGAGHSGADATRNVDEALKDLGILGPNDSTLSDIADGIDDFTDEAFGKKRPPDTLPPVRYRVFFGKKDDLMSGLSQMGEGLLSDAMAAGDSLLEQGAAALGVGDYLGTDPFSSVMAKHSPFAEDPKELDREESPWKLVSCRVDEGLNVVWRAELLLAAPEIRDPALESSLDAESAAGGLVDQIAGPIKSALSALDTVKDIANGDDGGEHDQLKQSEADLADAEDELAQAHERLDALEDLLAEANNRSPPASAKELADLEARVADARAEVAAKKSAVQTAERDLAARRARSRKKKSGAAGIADRVAGITDAFGRIGDDPMGALTDIVFGADSRGGWPDGPVYVNVPLDPGDFLGQTLSLRVSREFASDPPAGRPNDVAGHSFTARYLTGVVVEMQDLGVRQPPLNGPPVPPGTTSARWLRLVVGPELTKLSLRRDHRLFNKMSALEIVRDVLRSAGVYGFLPDLPGVGAATDALSGLVEKVPFVGGAVSDAISGQFIRAMPPMNGLSPITEDQWTQKREMCVQYGETDLDFVCRLLEEEGIHFAFEQRRGFERLVLLHDPMALDQAPTVDGKPAPFFWPHWLSEPNVETVTRAAERRGVRPGKVTLRDFTFSKSDQTPTSREAIDASSQPEAETAYGERYEYPGNYPFQYIESDAIHYRDYVDPADRDLARLRLEEEASRARRVTLHTDVVGVSSCTSLRLRGVPFERDGQALDPSDETPTADLIVVDRVRWTGGDLTVLASLAGALPSVSDIAEDYENEVGGFWMDRQSSARTPVRPERRTPKPRITSLQTATVVDHEGDHDEDEEIHRDHPTLGRVLVRFHWDRRGEMPLGLALPLIGRGTSAWCRVAQPWAGDDFGVFFEPRIGSEVVVAFENGDPDRPYVIGSLYDGEHPVPVPGRETRREGFTPPEARAEELSTIMTRTTPWDPEEGVASELTFDDTVNRERVVLKAGRHLVEEVRANHATNVSHDQSNEVARHHGEIVEKQQELDVRESRVKEVHGDQLVTVKGNRKSTVGDAQRIEILRDHDERVKGVVEIKVRGSRTLSIHGERVTKVGEPGQEPVDDIHEIGGAKTDVITGALTVLAGAIALGQPGGPGAGAPAAEIGAGPLEEGGYALDAKTDDGITLKASKEVRIVSENDMVDLYFGGDFAALVAGNTLGMAESGAGGVLARSDTRVAANAEKSLFVVTPGEVRLRAMGEADALAIVAASGVLVSGPTGVVKATVAIVSEAPTKVGP